MTPAYCLDMGEHPQDIPRVLARWQAAQDEALASDEQGPAAGMPVSQTEGD